MLRLLIAPQEFKGSLTAVEACAAMRAGAERAGADLSIDSCPLSDGGGGLARVLVAATAGELRTVTVEDPLGRAVSAEFGVINDGRTAVIELAAASGLSLLKQSELDPLRASTFGTGQMILAALNRGIRDFIVGLGGSATNDGGAGIAQALGAKLRAANGEELARGGAAVAGLQSIDATGLDARLAGVTFLVASDVRNPLCGAMGASAVFGPQKGATPQMVAELDHALAHYAGVIRRDLGRDVADVPGAGAAGGAGAGLLAFLNAEIRPGFDLVAQATNLRRRLLAADLVLTGEGRLDEQSQFGKVVGSLAGLAREAGVPAVAFAGSLGNGCEAGSGNSVIAAFSIVPGPVTLDDAIAHAADYLAARTEAVVRLALTAATPRTSPASAAPPDSGP